MSESTLTMGVRIEGGNGIIDVKGDVTGASEQALTDAYNEATAQGAKRIVLNFEGLDYMNSSGIGLLVTMLVRAQRHGQKVCAYGLSDHYRQIFELTRLDDAIAIYGNEEEALA
ncbi:MAG: STAS domain-containing protein [Actinomycetota bacterium]|nr:STAS domain-containing protein [Actinomycetota bacterium]